VKFAETHDPDGMPWTELTRFQQALRCRDQSIKLPRGSVEDGGGLPAPPAARPVPRHPGEGPERRGFGADLALELCLGKLPDVPGVMKEIVDILSHTSQREPIMLVVDCARRKGLIPQV